MPPSQRFSLARFFPSLLLLATFLAALTLLPAPGHAGQATLTWVAPTTYVDGTPITNMGGYKVHQGTASGSYSQSIDVGNVTSYTLSNLVDGATHYFAISAYDASGNQSGYSAETTKVLPPTYTITATAGAGGTITPQGNVTVNTATNGTSTIKTVTLLKGSTQSFTITPSAGYTIAGVTVDGTSVGVVTSYTFSNITANHTISATFASTSAPTYAIAASAGTGGTISPAGTTSVTSGANQAYTITPAAGYRIAGVTVDGAAVGAVSTYTFSNVTANHTIAATFAAVPATTYSISASAGAGGSISPSGTVSVTSGASQSFTITPATGYRIAGVTVDGASVGAVATYTFSGVTANRTISATFAPVATGSAAYALNAGGPQVTGASGTAYAADANFSGGSTSSTTAAITGTTDPGVYQSERYGNFAYNVPMANGNYSVTLKFAEIYFAAAGQRVFSVSINGQTVISNLDVFAKVGKNAAYDVTVPAAVTNGVLSITFTSQVNYAKVSAITVAPMTSTAGTVAYAVNGGGAKYTDAAGTNYVADTNFTGGTAGTTTAAITGTTDPSLYQSERYGNFSYSVPLTNGNYSVTLKFAENYWTAAGKRVFSVAMNGQTVITDLDLYAKAGKNAAYDVTVPVTVTNGTLGINFISKVNNAKIGAIVVRRM